VNKFLVIKNVLNCNNKCWFCSTSGDGYIEQRDIVRLYDTYKSENVLLIGGEPMMLPPEYYSELLDKGLKFSLQSNIMLYDSSWDCVLTHKNFQGLSVSGDKFDIVADFFTAYEMVREVVGYSPPVLIVLDTNKNVSLLKAEEWVSSSIAKDFPLKINYIVPSGLAARHKERILKVSDVFDIYTRLIDAWIESGFHEIQPFTNILNSLKGGNDICPYIKTCINDDVMVNIETDFSSYPCPVMGDMRKERKDLKYDIPKKCFICDHFNLCRGCTIRNWMVESYDDTNYCESAKRFFSKLKGISYVKK